MRSAILIAALVLAGPATAVFDCTKGSIPDESAICASPKLPMLDALVSRAEAGPRKGLDEVPDADDRAEDARAFNARKAHCNANIGCLFAAHAASTIRSLSGPDDVFSPARSTLGLHHGDGIKLF